MLFDGALIAAAASAAIAFSLGLIADHYRRRSRALAGELRERSATATAFAEGHARYRLMFDGAPMACIVWEPGFRIAEWNAEAERIFGWTREEMVGRSLLSALIPLYARHRMMQETTTLFADACAHRTILPGITRGGRTVACEWHHAVARDERGTPARVVSLCVDVTATEELKHENALFRSIIDLTDDPHILILDRDAGGRVVYAGDSACRHFGRSREDLLGTTPVDWDPHTPPERVAEIGNAVERGGVLTFETEHRRADGRLVPVEVTANRVDHGDRRYVAIYQRDISVRKAQEASLRDLRVKAALLEHEKRYREVFENASDALFTVNVDNGVRFVFDSLNPAAAEAFGMPAATLRGMSFEPVIDGMLGADFGRSLAEVRPHFEACARSGMPVDFEARLDLLPAPVGADRLFQVRLIPLADDGGIERIICICHDITLRKRYEDELRQRAALEERMSRYFTNAPGYFFTLRLDANGAWSMPFASPGIRDTHGLDPADVVADISAIAARLHPGDVERVMGTAAASARDLVPCHTEYRVLHPQKGERWIEARSLPQRQEDGSTLMHGFMHDITERNADIFARRQAETELRRQADFQRTLLDAINDVGLQLMVVENGRIVHVGNRKLAYEFGYSDAEIDAHPPLLEIVHPDDRERVMDLHRRRLSGEPIANSYELTLVTSDGERRDYETSAIVVPGTEPLRVVTVGKDITARKRAEATLRFVARREWVETGEGFLAALGRHLGTTLGVAYVVIDRLVEEPGIAETIALYARGDIVPNMRYALHGTPCENVVGKTLCSYREGIQAMFPDDALLVDMDAESYAGIPLWDSDGLAIGLIAVLDDKPMRDETSVAHLLQLVAPAVAAELERERTDRALRRRERQLAAVAEAVPGFLFTLRVEADGRAHFPYASEGAVSLIGLAPEEFRDDAEVLRARYHPEDLLRLRGLIAETGRTLAPFRIDLRIRHPEAGERWAEIRSTPQRQPDGATEWHGVMVDIGDRKRLEAALTRSEREFRSLAENTPDNIARFDPAGRYLYINPTHERTLGKSRDEAVGTVIPDSHAKVKAAIAEVAAGGEPVHVVRQPVVIAGTEELHDIRLVPEFDAAGRLVSVLGLGRDMTAFYRMQEALAAREQEFRSLAESSPDSIIRYDREHRIVYLNATLMRELGLAGSDAVIGHRPVEVWPDGRFAAIERAAERVLASGTPETIELVWERRPGDTVVSQIRIVPEHGIGGEIVGTLAFGRDITAIREAERRLKHFVDNLPGLAYTFRLAPDGSISFPYVSHTVEEYYGAPPGDERANLQLIHGQAHPDDRPRIEAAIEVSARDMTPFRVESRVCRPGQPVRWLDVRSLPMREADGSILWYGIMLDITERKRIETALQDKRRALAEAQRLACVGSWELDIQRGALSWSDEIFRIFEIDPAHFGASYEAFLNAVHPDDREAVNAAYTASLADRTPYEIDHRLLFPDGRIKHVHERCETTYDADDKPLRSSGTVQDVTERKRLEDALRRREEDFRALAENSPDIIARYDAEGRRLYLNAAYETVFRVPVAGLLGKTHLEAASVPPEEARRIHDLILGVAGSGRAAALELAWRRANGSPLGYHIRAVPEFDDAARVVSVLAVARDITALKETERQLIESRTQLRELTARREDAREQERKRVAHELHEELGQVLSALRMNVSALPLLYGDRTPELGTKAQEMLGLIDRSLQGMRGVVTELRPTTLDAGIAVGLEWLTQDFAQRSGIACGLHLPEQRIELPDVQATAVFRIVQEALDNVSRHAGAGRADVVLARDAEEWCLTVRDDGCGFDAEPPTSGGLGLLGMRERAVALGGAIQIAKPDAGGTLIRLRFPIEP